MACMALWVELIVRRVRLGSFERARTCEERSSLTKTFPRKAQVVMHVTLLSPFAASVGSRWLRKHGNRSQRRRDL